MKFRKIMMKKKGTMKKTNVLGAYKLSASAFNILICFMECILILTNLKISYFQ